MSAQNNSDQGAREVRLPAEPGTAVIMNIAGVAERIQCTYVGMQVGQSIIVRLPQSTGVGWKIADGATATVRYLVGGTVYGFHTGIMGRYEKGPLRFLFLGFPKSIETHNLRKVQRVSCYLPATVSAGEHSMEGVVTDIGPGGVKFIHRVGAEEEPPPVTLSQEVTLQCSLLGMEGVQTIGCQVRNLNVDQVYLSLGLAFSGADDQLVGSIKDYVEKVFSLMADEEDISCSSL